MYSLLTIFFQFLKRLITAHNMLKQIRNQHTQKSEKKIQKKFSCNVN